MDLATMLFYGAVCGLLSLFSPVIGNGFTRLIIGIAIGVAASVAMPSVRPFIEDLLATYLQAAPSS